MQDDRTGTNPERLSLDQKIEIWKFAIETQKHFAELSLRMRQLSLAVTGAIIAFASLLYARNQDFFIEISGLMIPVSSLLIVTAALLLLLAGSLDVSVYHKMLRGAVSFNEYWESELSKHAGWSSGLTNTISAYSRFENPVLTKGKWHDKGSGSNAAVRIWRFYYIPAVGLVIVALAMMFIDAPIPSPPTEPQSQTEAALNNGGA